MPGGLTPGDALWLRFLHSAPPKNKICLCICVEEGIFLVISSKPYKAAPADSQVAVYPEDLSILTHTSYLDVSKCYDDFPPHEIARGISRGICPLSVAARARIKQIVNSQPYLLARVKKKILQQL
jgi:hypothetical protein